MSQNKDRHLKQQTKEIFEGVFSGLQDLLVRQEVSINFTDRTDSSGNLLTEDEVDVVVSFRYNGHTVLIIVECENVDRVRETTRIYADNTSRWNRILEHPERIRVLHSQEGAFSNPIWSAEEVRFCYIYRPSIKNLASCVTEAKKEKIIVWGQEALKYYLWISECLGGWARYEVFKELGLKLEPATTEDVEAFRIKQKETEMYVAAIHPAVLLRIGYVLRRASPRLYAYQRLVNKARIASIHRFIASTSPAAIIPNTIILVFDSDPEIQRRIVYHPGEKKLTIPTTYCSAWIIDGQHRAFGFISSEYAEKRSSSPRFELPVVIFKQLPEELQTKIFIDINHNQKKIKPELLCDLTTLTKDLGNKLTWPSLLGRALNDARDSPLYEKVRISELHRGRPIGLSSLVQYGLLESLLGFKVADSGDFMYDGPLYKYAKFNPKEEFGVNQAAFRKQRDLLIRFLVGVKKNTQCSDERRNPWINRRRYALLKPAGINALFLVLAKILAKYPSGELDFNNYLKPLKKINFSRHQVAILGGGWKGFRGLANKMIRALDKEKLARDHIGSYYA